MQGQAADNEGLNQTAFLQLLIIDALLYVSLFWRDYGDPAQMLIAHYVSFVAITDLAVFFLPRSQRHWFNLFRVSSSIAYLVLIGALAAKGLDGESLALTALRFGLILVRLAHASWLWRCAGPSRQALFEFPGRALAFYRSGDTSQRLGCVYLLIGCALLYFPQLAYWTHFNAGEDRLDDVLTGLQAQAGLNFCIKLFVCEVLVTSATARLWMRSLIALLFILQWPLMPGMFFKAPIPVAHAAVELYELALVWAALRYRPQER